jgi:hypothetical protein
MDCTGSMSSYIKETRDHIVALQKQIIASVPEGSKVSCAFVGYRDFGDTPVPTFPFSADTVAFQEHLKSKVKAEGGDDECEDVLGGLSASNGLLWDDQIRTKILFHVADAPCHGTFFAGGVKYNDAHGTVDSTGAETKSVLQDLCSKKGVQYLFLRINDRTTNMIVAYNKLMATMPMKPQITTHKLSEAADIIKIAVASTVASISAEYSKASAVAGGSKASYLASVNAVVFDAVSKTSSRRKHGPSVSFDGGGGGGVGGGGGGGDGDGGTERRTSCLLPSWIVGASVKDKVGAQIVEVSSLVFPECIADLKKPMKLTEVKPRDFVLDDGNAFDKGACREVSHARDVTFDEPVEYVLKLHIDAEDLKTERCNAIGDLQCQAVAAYLAKSFSDLEVIKKTGKSVTYLKSKLVKLKTRAGKLRYGSIERVLDGEFLKWCSNGHYQKGAADPDFSATLAAFTHWTYEVTDGHLMVVDVQGIRTDDRTHFILTDPAVHCIVPEKFGRLNLGEDGMSAFWASHECNVVCKALRLKKR